MAAILDRRLDRLRQRRSGLDRLNRLDAPFREAVQLSYLTGEAWQRRAQNQPRTQYVLGAMAQVDPDSTRISIETAERVGNQLAKRLPNEGIHPEFRVQGSVALNVHIHGVSDVDLLVLDPSFVIYDSTGVKGRAGHYSATPRTSVSVLSALRAATASALDAAFPAASVDQTGSKCLTVSGGSLARTVDVVPAHWYETSDYQSSGREHDRGVYILDRSVPETKANFPFLHIQRISQRCDQTAGSLRKAIRLCKNIKAELEAEGESIALSSFDIASVLYHADMRALLNGAVYELAVLAEAQRHFDHLYHRPDLAATLRVPDGSREILDSPAKQRGLNRMSTELDSILRAVALEQAQGMPPATLEEGRRLVGARMVI